MPVQDSPRDSSCPKEINIEKFEFDAIQHEVIPFVQINRDALLGIRDNMAAGFLWVYLESLPPTWEVKKEVIMKELGLSERTYQRHMSYLAGKGLISYQQKRYADGTMGPLKIKVHNGLSFTTLKNAQNDEIDDVQNGQICPNGQMYMSMDNRTAKFGEPVETQAQSELSKKMDNGQPHRQNTGYRLNGDLINKYINNTNKQKTYMSISDEMNESKNVVSFEKSKPETQESEKFKKFWDAYPRKEKKKRTLEIWNRKGLEKYFDEIMQDLAQRLQHKIWDKKTLRFIPLPDSYLNGERWNDELNLEAVSGDKASFMPSNPKSDYHNNQTYIVNIALPQFKSSYPLPFKIYLLDYKLRKKSRVIA